MSKRELDSLSSIIGRLEDWQNRDGNREAIKKAGVDSNINAAKSRLLDVLRTLENA
jgi:hypothetical protein